MEDMESTRLSVLSHSTDEDLFSKYFIPKSKDIEIVLIDDIKQEAPDPGEDTFSPVEDRIAMTNEEEEDDEEHTKVNGFEDGDDEVDKADSPNYPIPFVNTRPTRNRTRSIKTRHVDFFYELNKTLKPNETPSGKTNGQKSQVKKNPALVCQKPKNVSPKSAKVS